MCNYRFWAYSAATAIFSLSLLFVRVADAKSLGGHCKNWMQISSASENIATTCARMRKHGDFIAEVDPRGITCLVCAIEDWTPATKVTGGCGGVPGVWSWFVNGNVTFRANGTHSQGSRHGTWSCSGQTVRMIWAHGYTDVLTLAPSGRRLAGHGWKTGNTTNKHAVSGSR